MLGFVKRDIHVVQAFLEAGYALPEKHQTCWERIQKIYEQQQYMYGQRTHSVADRIVSFHQPWIRPIVRGKAKAAVEYGAKFDLSMDNGIGRLDRGFSLLKRCFSAGLIRTKRKDTTLTSITLSMIAMNLSKLTADFLHLFFRWSLSFRTFGSKSLVFS